MTIIERIKEYFNPAIAGVDGPYLASDGTWYVTVRYCYRESQTKYFYGPTTTLCGGVDAKKYYDTMQQHMRKQKDAYVNLVR